MGRIAWEDAPLHEADRPFNLSVPTLAVVNTTDEVARARFSAG